MLIHFFGTLFESKMNIVFLPTLTFANLLFVPALRRSVVRLGQLGQLLVLLPPRLNQLLLRDLLPYVSVNNLFKGCVKKTSSFVKKNLDNILSIKDFLMKFHGDIDMYIPE